MDDEADAVAGQAVESRKDGGDPTEYVSLVGTPAAMTSTPGPGPTESITQLADRIRKEGPEVRRVVADDKDLITSLAEFIPDEQRYLDPDYVQRLERGDTKAGSKDEWLEWATKYVRLLDVIRGLYVPV
jgi:hypothetical protein